MSALVKCGCIHCGGSGTDGYTYAQQGEATVAVGYEDCERCNGTGVGQVLITASTKLTDKDRVELDELGYDERTNTIHVERLVRIKKIKQEIFDLQAEMKDLEAAR